MKNRFDKAMFFIDKCKFLKLKIFLSSIIKALVYILQTVNLILVIFLMYDFYESNILDKKAIIYLAGLFILYLGLRFIDVYYSHYISYDVIEKLRGDVFSHYYKISPGAVENIKVGDFVQMIINDINVFEWFIAHILTEWIAFLLISIVVITLVSLKSIASGVIIFLFLLFVIRLFIGSLDEKEKQGIEIKNMGGDLIANATDGILGFKELLFFDRETDFFNKIEKKSKEYNKVSGKYSNKELKDNLVLDLLGLALFLIILIIFPAAAFEKIVYLALIVAYYYFLRNCMHQTGNFGFIFGALNRLKNLYDIKPLIDTYGPSEIDRSKINQGIEFLNCYFYYEKNPDKAILKDFSFKANRGEKTVIVSASGGGKSTIFKLINRYYELKGGHIKIFGRDIKSYTENTLRKNITTFSQNIFFFNDSLLNNFKYAKEDVSIDEIEDLARKLNSYDMIMAKEKGLDNLVKEAGQNYSGGELQRLAIIRGLIKDSPVLLMDEVSSALDEKNEEFLNELLDEIKKDKVIIISAHKLSTIQNADRIIFIKDGRVEGTGKYDELILNNKSFNELLMGSEWRKENEN